MITNREKEILQYIKENPMISQQEIADKTNITRSSVAVHISNLMSKGYIRGKGYLLPSEEYIIVIGSANIDIIGFANEKIITGDSNVGKVNISQGGVGRNVAYSLKEIGFDVHMITAFGDDSYGRSLRETCLLEGIDISKALHIPGEKTSTYITIIDEKGDLLAGINDMDIYRLITPEIMEDRMVEINNALVCMLETNIPKETIEYIAENTTIPIFCETVSTSKVHKLKNIMDKIHTLRADLIDIESFLNTRINDQESLVESVDYLLDLGLKNIFINVSEKEILCANNQTKILYSFKDKKLNSKRGVRDDFMSSLIHSYIQGEGFTKVAEMAIINTYIYPHLSNGSREDVREENLPWIKKIL